MPRIYAPQDGGPSDVSSLKDYQPYEATLTGYEGTVGSEEYGSKPRLQLDWSLENGVNLRDWCSFSIGKMSTGQPSKYRQLLNASAGRAGDSAIEWIDDETMEFKFPDEKEERQLKTGVKVTIRGRHNKRYTPSGDELDRFNVISYEPSSGQIPF